MRVREDDPAIAASDVRLEGAGFGDSIRAYAARPREARADTPSIVVVHHLWGVDTQIRDVVRRFAKEGFIAIAPA
ncbi:MAG TPA: dienelactone hydrolase family protein, partial [Candidatus Baltobacteraceae bacterium]|nr:dienelactone hydrolase family protein [Candidatus Baltobacteraceae bacterium]